MTDKNLGVITEQGFVLGENLGFTPVTINEDDKTEKNKNPDDSDN